MSTRPVNLERLWLLLLGLTGASALIAESAPPGLAATVVISAVVAFKGLMVVEHFMEMRHANRYLRRAMTLYFYVVPLLVVLVQLFPAPLVRLTTLE